MTVADADARHAALTAHERSLLVEAGAGSGKTAILAGRIATLLAAGIAPGRIAAVTFTELAASELLARVQRFVAQLLQGLIPVPLRSAFPRGLSEDQRACLGSAAEALDEINCSTIHGFCQKLIAPYPVEADMDPGARVIDGAQADLAFTEVVNTWLRGRLSVAEEKLLDAMVRERPEQTLRLVREILDALRRYREIAPPAPAPLQPCAESFAAASAALSTAVQSHGVAEPDTAAIASHFRKMAESFGTVRSLETPSELVRLLTFEPHRDLCRADGAFRVLKKKGKWVEAGKRAGLAKAECERLYLDVERGYLDCCAAWNALIRNAATAALTLLCTELKTVIARYQAFKRSAAVLDFDDLIVAARNLLRKHEPVRRALARLYSHILVDEFQDTDLNQIDILWRLCGDPTSDAEGTSWSDFRIRPGALFLVGDPKQAIYRFRGADVAAYLQARDTFQEKGAGEVLCVSTNFRSCESILRYINARFEAPLSSAGQPGFTRLEPPQGERTEGPCVLALEVRYADVEGKVSAEQQRDAEAEAVAQLCAQLIDNLQIPEEGSRGRRALRPSDVALLAPTGTDLWRYEEALERRGIPVATQAGKGLYRRQEIQDLIAVTRVLADPRDTLALGAVLRGPLVGLTEEALADIVWALPRPADDSSGIPRLDLRVQPQDIRDPLARDILGKLQTLRRQVNEATPYEVLARALEILRVRPVLVHRYPRHSERALANVDLYLNLARSYRIRGLRAFAEAMTAAWVDGSRAVEGVPDTDGEAVALYTMHAAKGLEWPVVVPINGMTTVQRPQKVIVDRSSGYLYCPILAVDPTGYDVARSAEEAELQRERARLWYVAATRSRELLVIPRADIPAPGTAWISAVDLAPANLPPVELSRRRSTPRSDPLRADSEQTLESFRSETERIHKRHRALTWLAPSREEGVAVLEDRSDSSLKSDEIDAGELATSPIRGGRERGAIIHKLLEEVLTGETHDDRESLVSRARDLIQEIGCSHVDEPSRGLSSLEIGECIARTLALPEIASLRPSLVPEVSVFSSTNEGSSERAVAGVTDAVSLDENGDPQSVIDWKSDVEVTPVSLAGYRTQIRAYLESLEIEHGLLVFVTSGTLVPVTRSELR